MRNKMFERASYFLLFELFLVGVLKFIFLLCYKKVKKM